jgi:signal transduction histidine kinase
MRWSLRSIRARLLAALLAVWAVAALLIGGFTYREVAQQTQALFDYQLRQMALSLRDQGEIAPSEAAAFADEQLDFVVQIWTVDGRSIYASREHSALPNRALLGLADMQAGGRIWRTYSVATRNRVIQVAQPLEIRQRRAADAALRSVLPLALLAPLLALAGGWLAARTLMPLQQVAADVRQRDERSLQPLPEEGLPDEVAPLVGSLNALLERLGQALRSQRAFVSDAAHELRSPLTALKLQLRVLERTPDEPGRAAAQQALAEGIERAIRLVEQLLALARSEPLAVAAGTPLHTVDLALLIDEAIAELALLAAERGVGVQRAGLSSAGVNGDPQALKALVRNLLDNAVRYGAADGRPPRVQARLEREADGALRLEVHDSGPGIAEDERARVFDRFYRGPQGSRSEQAGTGLGLAIVRSVAEQHRATVTLADSPLGGLRATVRFARAA